MVNGFGIQDRSTERLMVEVVNNAMRNHLFFLLLVEWRLVFWVVARS